MSMNQFVYTNSQILTVLTTGFCKCNQITLDPDMNKAITRAVYDNLKRWYEENGLEINLAEELVKPEALEYAFERMQNLVDIVDRFFASDAIA